MIGQEWLYISQHGKPAVFEIKTARVIAETLRKWILRETKEIDNEIANPHHYKAEPGEGRCDWTIPKKGDARREGKGGPRKGYTRIFTAHRHIAEAMIRERQDEIWANKNVYRIAQQLQYTTVKDPATLRKVAELIGYKEEAET